MSRFDRRESEKAKDMKDRLLSEKLSRDK